ncbi:MAG: quinol:electron acceptor oxidoreductase subunit ActD [Myxococcota bacterium]
MSTKEDQFRDGGVLAEFKDVTTLVKACEKIRDEGYQKWDAYSPFPVHGIDPAMGIKMTKIPAVVLCAGLTGATTAITLQWYTNAYDYQFMISGKPIWSIPANIPVGFELTVLFSAFTAFFITLGINKLPSFYNPLFNHDSFKRVTDDAFFITISSADKKYDFDKCKDFLDELGALEVERIKDDSHIDAALPRKLKIAAAVMTCLTFIPLGIIAKARTGYSDKPRVHIIQDMDMQPKFKTQISNDLFPDKRAMRLYVEGTIPVGEPMTDDHFERGVDAEGAWVTSLPPQVELNEATVKRGEERYGIYCGVCHGSAGYGDGLVHRRAEKIGSPKWVAPSSLHQDYIRAQPVGQLYHTIKWGIRNMPGYAHAIPTADRWAIVTYIKALQLSQGADLDNVPEDAKKQLQ